MRTGAVWNEGQAVDCSCTLAVRGADRIAEGPVASGNAEGLVDRKVEDWEKGSQPRIWAVAADGTVADSDIDSRHFVGLVAGKHDRKAVATPARCSSNPLPRQPQNQGKMAGPILESPTTSRSSSEIHANIHMCQCN
jgi:hypothetical protein